MNTTLEISHLKDKVILTFRNDCSPGPRSSSGYPLALLACDIEHEAMCAL